MNPLILYLFIYFPSFGLTSWHVISFFSWPGIKPKPPALEARSLSHWITRDIPKFILLVVSFALLFSCWVVTNSATPWIVACQAPLSVGFPRQEYWSGLPFPAPRDLPDPGINPMPLVSSALAGEFYTTGPPGKPIGMSSCFIKMFSILKC